MRVITPLLLLLACGAVNAAAIDVTYTVSGSPGAWTLDFAVTNQMTAWPTQDIYQFGVLLSGPGVSASPGGYDPNVYGSWTNFFSGGSPVFYNNIWFDGNDFNHLLPGTSLSGFMATVADAAPPLQVSWFAYSVASSFDPADLYTGSDAFVIDPNFLTAGFEGTATPTAGAVGAPEASSLMLMAIGIGAGALLRKPYLKYKSKAT
ncbi:MAG: hypothetical protein ABI806_03955 [Candidatus Solibacter sp.]